MNATPDTNDTRASIQLSSLTGGLAFALYLYTLAPTVSGEDGGELVAAAYTLGIPHPTGYPIWTILAFIFTKLIPFGEIAWRVNLMSAFWGAATVGILTHTLQRLSVHRAIACTVALSFAFSREFWEQSIIAEVYTLNAFFTVTCIYLLLDWTQTRNTWTLYIFTILYSLSLANHSTMYLLGPLFLTYIFISHPPIMKNYRVLSACACLFLIGLLVHLYLPIRSRANPTMDWGNPETFSAFWDVFTRRQYHSIMTGERSLSLTAAQLLEFTRYAIWEFTPWVLVLALPGTVLLYRRSRSAFALITGIFTIVFAASIFIPNFPIEHHSVWMNTTYWIPCFLMLAFPIAFGVNALYHKLPDRTWMRADVLLIVVASPLLTHFDHNDQSDYYYSRDYAQNQLNTMSPDAIFFGSGDYTIFPITYLHLVEGQRSDVTLANQYGYISPELYSDMPDDLRATLPEHPSESDDPVIFEWILANTSRPVYTTTLRKSSTRTADQRGLLYEYRASEAEDAPLDIWSTYTWHEGSLDTTKTHTDWTAELINYEYRVKRARDAFANQDTDIAVSLLHEAEPLVHGDKRALYNIGLTFAQGGILEEAIRVFTLSLQNDPDYIPSRYNLAQALLKQQRFEEALSHSKHLLTLDPANPAYLRQNEKILQGLSTLQD